MSLPLPDGPAVAKADRAARVWQGPPSGPIEIGSKAHKELFCRMLLDTFNPYKPAIIDWPRLAEAERARLVGLPIWDIAVATEGKAKLRVLSYAALVADPLLEEAVRLNGFEEGRHKQVLANLVAAYGIELDPEPAYLVPRDAEWAFMVTGFSECIDSFFAFGLFEAARLSGYFPPALVDTFEPVMQEECRHILFFVNWVAWHRRNLPWWKKPIFAARVAAVWAFLAWERLQTARDVGGGNNFTMTGHESMGISLDVV
ncbi:MAG TPA: ferritin-like domain-containing protein, partial [Stellaceae bacterium]|nr:ferritin-like domain-containing protein [Stellaceae bacterium]